MAATSASAAAECIELSDSPEKCPPVAADPALLGRVKTATLSEYDRIQQLAKKISSPVPGDSAELTGKRKGRPSAALAAHLKKKSDKLSEGSSSPAAAVAVTSLVESVVADGPDKTPMTAAKIAGRETRNSGARAAVAAPAVVGNGAKADEPMVDITAAVPDGRGRGKLATGGGETPRLGVKRPGGTVYLIMYVMHRTGGT